MDTAIRAIQRGGKKKGALCFYMENWHLDFQEFLDWKQAAGDDYQRMRTANTAAYISDEFMKRVAQSAPWYLFDPKETPDLNELYGEAFSKRYAEYIELAEAGKLKMVKKMPAEELYRQMLVSLQTTSHPWLVWKDTINVRALNNNTGTIHMSNLCTEICLPQDKQNIAVCNLASLNIVAHLVEKKTTDLGGKEVIVKEIDWAELERTTRLAIRHLDNLIDINKPPVPEAAKSDKENRAVGLGVMGLSDLIEKLGFPYESEETFNLTDKLFEFISYHAIDESANLAAERGSYTHFFKYNTRFQNFYDFGDSITASIREKRNFFASMDLEHATDLMHDAFVSYFKRVGIGKGTSDQKPVELFARHTAIVPLKYKGILKYRNIDIFKISCYYISEVPILYHL
jgi:ribonucleoside-diphosphate reductase alpha chain